jgi:hypothetical protein
MSLLYRSSAIGTKVAELVVNSSDIVCVLTDKTSKTAMTVVCMTIPQAERLMEQFLHPKKPY